MSVVSAYAPIAKAPPGVKERFENELQDTLDHIPPDDVLLVLGDFNARVGKRETESDVWRDVRGKHGVGSCNEAGEQLLELCVINNLSIMNTWFEKRRVHQTTWTHTATRQSHMIDFVLMRKGHRSLCCDVRVYRSACCWSDHYMVKGRIRLQLPSRRKRKCETHLPLAVHRLSSRDVREEFQQSMDQCLLQHPHIVDGHPEENWKVLKKCIMETAERCVGRSRKRQPDWFSDAIDTLMPLMIAKQRAYCKFLQSYTVEDIWEFRRHQRVVKNAVDEAKEKWISRVIGEAECSVKDGKHRWMCIRKLQMQEDDLLAQLGYTKEMVE